MKTRRQKRSCTTSPRTGQSESKSRKIAHPILTKTAMDDLTALERRKEKAKLQRLRRQKQIKNKDNEKSQKSKISTITIDTSTSGSENNMINSDVESTNSEVDGQLSFGANNIYAENKVNRKISEKESRQKTSHINTGQSTASDVAKLPLHSGEHTAASNETSSKNHGPSLESETKIALASSGKDESNPFGQPKNHMQIGCSRTLEWNESKIVNLQQKNVLECIIDENGLNQKKNIGRNLQVNDHQNGSFASANDINREQPNDNPSKNMHISNTLPTKGGTHETDQSSQKKISQETTGSALNTSSAENKKNLPISKHKNSTMSQPININETNIEQPDKNNSLKTGRNIPSSIQLELTSTTTTASPKEATKNGQEKSREKNKSLAKTSSSRVKRVIHNVQNNKRPLPVHRVKCPICGDMFDPFNIEYHASHCGNPESPPNKVNEEQNKPKQRDNPTSKKNSGRAKDNKVTSSGPSIANEINPQTTNKIETDQRIHNPILNKPVCSPPNTNAGMKPPVAMNNSMSSANFLNSQSSLQSNDLYTYKNDPNKSIPSKVSTDIGLNCNSTTTSAFTKVPPLSINLSEISKLDRNERTPVKYKSKNNNERGITKLLQPESSTFDMLSTSLLECSQLPQHAKMSLKKDEVNIYLAEQKKLAKRKKKIEESSLDSKDCHGQSFLEAVGIVTKQDMVVQSIFPSYIEMNQSGKKRKKWHHHHHLSSNSIVPLSDKPHASVNDAELFLSKLKIVATEINSRRQCQIESKLDKNEKSSCGNKVIVQALRFIRSARDGDLSILSLMKEMKMLIKNLTNQLGDLPHKQVVQKELISLFESFLPAFYSLKNVLSSKEENTHSPSLSVRTHTSILWEPKEASKSQFVHTNKTNHNPINPRRNSPTPQRPAQSIPYKKTEAVLYNSVNDFESAQRSSSEKLNEDYVQKEKTNIGNTSVSPSSTTNLSKLNSTELVNPQISRKTNKATIAQPNNESKHQMEACNEPPIVNERQRKQSHISFSHESTKSRVSDKQSLFKKKRPKITKATNTFTHFCRDVKPAIEKEIREDTNISLNNIKESVSERAKLQWKALSDSEREIYRKRSQDDYARFNLEMNELRKYSEEI